MIWYENAKLHPRRLLQRRGSVMPFSMGVALPCALLTIFLKLLPNFVDRDEASTVFDLFSIDDTTETTETIGSAAFSGLSFLIGFLVVFRSSQAYNRFWEGLSSLNAMQGEWWDAASSLVAFCKRSVAPHEEIILFQHTLVRLISMLNGCVLMELSAGFNREDHEAYSHGKRAFELELIDAEGIDGESLRTLNSVPEKVELVFQWIQQLVVEADSKEVFSVSGPVLSRAFQELSNGMVNYRQASKIARTPLPFPYMQATELLLISHWLCTPVLMCVWVESPLWAGILCFIQVMFYWSLNSIATELENPFGEDDNDLPAKEIQQDFNKRLLLLIRPGTVRTARLSKQAAFEETKEAKDGKFRFGGDITLGTSGVNSTPSQPGAPQLRRRNSLEENRISWGTLQSAIQEKMFDGTVSETMSDEGHSLLGDAPGSRSLSKSMPPRVTPKHRTPRRLSAQLHNGEVVEHLMPKSSKELPPFGADDLVHMEVRSLTAAVDPEKLGGQLACLTSLPELLTVCTEVRNQLKAVVDADESQPEAGSSSRRPSREAPSARPAPVAASAFGERLQPEAVHSVFGKSLGDSCLGIPVCTSRPSTSRV